MHARLLLSAVAAAAPLAAQVGYSTDFEAFNASATGTPAAGQDSFYIPAVANTVDGAIFTYAGNSLNVPANPNGGSHFYAGVSQLVAAVTNFSRAERPVTVTTSAIMSVEFDVCCNYIGAGTPSNNIGSFSLQPSAAATYPNILARWPTGATNPPPVWNADIVQGPGAGTQVVLADPAFQGLATNTWHRWGVTFDLAAGTYLEFRITNGATNTTTVFAPNPPLPLPNPGTTPLTAFRFFVGGLDNVMAIDNFSLTYGASYATFGAGCAGSTGTPTLAGSGLPRLGSTFTVSLGNLPLSVAVMATGFSNTAAFGGGVPLPFSLAGQGLPNCNLLVDPIAVQFLVGANNSASWNWNIPFVLDFAGINFFNQGVSLDSNPFASVTNGGAGVIGL